MRFVKLVARLLKVARQAGMFSRVTRSSIAARLRIRAALICPLTPLAWLRVISLELLADAIEVRS